MEDNERCTATARTTGERCKQPAIDGGNVCRFHGGSAEQVERKARERLEEMADTAAEGLQNELDRLFDKLRDVEDPDEYVKILREIRQISKMVFDRSGNGPTEKREHDIEQTTTHELGDDEKEQLDALFDKDPQ